MLVIVGYRCDRCLRRKHFKLIPSLTCSSLGLSVVVGPLWELVQWQVIIGRFLKECTMRSLCEML
jgi:hypothetical protein